MKPVGCLLAVLAASAFAAAVAQDAGPDPEVAASNVSKALQSTRGLNARDIAVSTHAGTVVLTGKVDSEVQRAAAQDAAEKAAAGVRISSSIEVRPLEERPLEEQQALQQSAQLVRDVEAALRADTRTANLGIVVSSADVRVVVLQGLVPSSESRAAVQGVASRVKGVTHVDNRIVTPGEIPGDQRRIP